MAEHDDEFPPKDAAGPPPHAPGEGGTPPPSHAPGQDATAPALHAPGEGGARPSYGPGEGAGPAAAGGPPGAAPRRGFQRWSSSGPVRSVAVGLLAGLVGGLVGGGVVAAFSDDGHRHARQIRVERGMPWGDPRFGPRYWGPPPGYGQWPPMRPGNPPQPTPVPSPTKTG